MILYVEPLLNASERSLTGLRVASVWQTNEAYCNYINLMTDVLGDFVRMSAEVAKFKQYSGVELYFPETISIK